MESRGYYSSSHAIGDPVLGQGNPGKVVAVIFTASAVRYEIEFDSGGAHSTLGSLDVTRAPAQVPG